MEQDINSRIDALESRFAIERLIAKYAQAFDGRDEQMLRGIWHEDAFLSLGETFGEFTGIDEILESARRNWQQMPHMHHWMANSVVEIDGDFASGRVAVDCLCTHVEMGPIQISGTYLDRFERREGRWAFIERRFQLHYLTPLAQWSPVAGSEVGVANTGSFRS
jgi:SnoaL-like domain